MVQPITNDIDDNFCFYIVCENNFNCICVLKAENIIS